MLEVLLGAALGVGVGAAAVVATQHRDARLISPEQFGRDFARFVGTIEEGARCGFCGDEVTADNARILYPVTQGTGVVCDRTECLLAFTQAQGVPSPSSAT